MYWQWANQYGDQAWLKQLLPLLTSDSSAASNGYYFDVIPWHWYSRSQDVYTKTQSAQNVLASNGITGKEVWINETNAPACNETVVDYVNCADFNNGNAWADGYATTFEQASYIIQASAYAFAVGATRVFEFQQQDDGNGQAWGLFRNDGTQRPIYQAYQLTAQYLAGFAVVRRSVVNGGEAVTFGVPGASPRRVTVLWNDTGTPLTASVMAAAAAPSSVSLIQQDGTTQAVTPAPSYSVILPGATDNRNYDQPWNLNDYIVGGQTMFLVENLPSDTTAPTSSVNSASVTGSPPSILVAWSGSDPSGWGVADYSVQFRDLTSASSWANWLTNTASTAASFTPVVNHTYQFRSLARDWSGNVEAKCVSHADVTVPTSTNSAATSSLVLPYRYYFPLAANGGSAC